MSEIPPLSDPSNVPPPPPTPPPAPMPSSSLGAPSPAVGAPAGGPGPLGKPRSIALVLLLTIVTFGIWAIVWSYQNGEEIKQHTRTGLGGVVYLLITLFISPVTMFLMASEVEQMYRREGKEPPITTIWGLWFLLPLIGNLIWYVRIQSAINDYWTTHGSSVKPGL
jgi:hypothetical protein